MVISGAPVKVSTCGNTVNGRLIQEDKGFQTLLDYEKKNLISLNQQFENNGQELTELERNFLEGLFFSSYKNELRLKEILFSKKKKHC